MWTAAVVRFGLPSPQPPPPAFHSALAFRVLQLHRVVAHPQLLPLPLLRACRRGAEAGC